jgi:hypothetical protein
VSVADDLSKGTVENFEVSDRIKFTTANLLDPKKARKVMKNIEICFHLVISSLVMLSIFLAETCSPNVRL